MDLGFIGFELTSKLSGARLRHQPKLLDQNSSIPSNAHQDDAVRQLQRKLDALGARALRSRIRRSSAALMPAQSGDGHACRAEDQARNIIE
jgi:hypothetical protein